MRPAHEHRTSRRAVGGGRLARGGFGRVGAAVEGDHVGGGERGGVGGGVGPGPGDDRGPEPGGTDQESEPDGDDADHHDGRRAALPLHFSTLMTARACKVGSGNSAPTSGRSVIE